MVFCCIEEMCCIGCSNALIQQVFSHPSTNHLPAIQSVTQHRLEIDRANHPAISWRSTITHQIIGTTWCQPPSHLQVIVQRFRITPAIFGNCQGQPPTHLAAISRRFGFTPDLYEIATANHSAIWCWFHLYCMVSVLYY